MKRIIISPYHLVVFLLVLGIIIYGSMQILQVLANDASMPDDFTVNYQAIRNWITTGENPYSYLKPESKLKPVTPFSMLVVGESTPYFHHPLLSAVLLAPFTLLPLIQAKALWIAINVILLAIGGLLLILQARTSMPPGFQGLFILFAALNFYSFNAYLMGSFLPLTLLFLGLTFWLISIRKDQISGFILTFTLINFQVGLIMVVALLIWAGSRKRIQFIRSFWAGIVFELILSLTLLPSWPVDWFRSVLLDSGIPGGYQSILNFIFKIGGATAIWPSLVAHLAILLLIIVALMQIKGKTELQLVWQSSLIFSLWSLILFPIEGSAAILCIPALLLFFSTLISRWKTEKAGVFGSLLALSFIIPWGTFFIGQASTHPTWMILLLLFPPVLSVLGLFWIRWWIVQPEY